jgi:hypothetical protein
VSSRVFAVLITFQASSDPEIKLNLITGYPRQYAPSFFLPQIAAGAFTFTLKIFRHSAAYLLKVHLI